MKSGQSKTRSRRLLPALSGAALVLAACQVPQSDPPPPNQPPTATAGAGAGGRSGAPAPGSGGAGGEATGGAAGNPAEPPPPDASPPLSPDAPPTGPTVDGPPTGASETPGLLFELRDPLPGLVQSHPSGDISWFDDPGEGRVVRLRAVDSNDDKERGEFDMDKGILKNGATVWVGWRAKLEIANPGQEWRNIFQEKSYGNFQENVPFCLRVDANTMRLLDPGGKAFWTHPQILNRWFTILMKIVYGTGQAGTIELWIDGEQQRFADGSTVAHLGTWGGGTQNMHWGVYRTARVSGTDAHYIGHLRVATTRELAAPP